MAFSTCTFQPGPLCRSTLKPAEANALLTIPLEEYVTNTPPCLVWAAILENISSFHNSG
jgi:hypothetical protein